MLDGTVAGLVSAREVAEESRQMRGDLELKR
jgi:hypothetical protein